MVKVTLYNRSVQTGHLFLRVCPTLVVDTQQSTFILYKFSCLVYNWSLRIDIDERTTAMTSSDKPTLIEPLS